MSSEGRYRTLQVSSGARANRSRDGGGGAHRATGLATKRCSRPLLPASRSSSRGRRTGRASRNATTNCSHHLRRGNRSMSRRRGTRRAAEPARGAPGSSRDPRARSTRGRSPNRKPATTRSPRNCCRHRHDQQAEYQILMDERAAAPSKYRRRARMLTRSSSRGWRKRRRRSARCWSSATRIGAALPRRPGPARRGPVALRRPGSPRPRAAPRTREAGRDGHHAGRIIGAESGPGSRSGCRLIRLPISNYQPPSSPD